MGLVHKWNSPAAKGWAVICFVLFGGFKIRGLAEFPAQPAVRSG